MEIKTKGEKMNKAEKWAEKNKWFGKNKSLTLVAFYFHDQLMGIKINPDTKKYYELINLYMEPFVKGKVKLKTRPKKMAPLTPGLIEIARKLKVPLEEYNKVRWGR